MKQKIKEIPWFSILGIIFVLFLIFGPSNSDSSELPDEGKYATITHEKYNFSIDYPTKWRVALYNDSGKESYDRRIKLELYIVRRRPFHIYIRQRSMKTPTIQDVSKWCSNVIDSDHNINPVEAFSDEINGQQVLRRRIYWRSYTTEYVCFVRQNDMIVISMDVKQDEYDENIDDFNAIVESFRPFK